MQLRRQLVQLRGSSQCHQEVILDLQQKLAAADLSSSSLAQQLQSLQQPSGPLSPSLSEGGLKPEQHVSNADPQVTATADTAVQQQLQQAKVSALQQQLQQAQAQARALHQHAAAVVTELGQQLQRIPANAQISKQHLQAVLTQLEQRVGQSSGVTASGQLPVKAVIASEQLPVKTVTQQQQVQRRHSALPEGLSQGQQAGSLRVGTSPIKRRAELERQNTSLSLELAAAAAQLSQAEDTCAELRTQASDAHTQLASTQERCSQLETQASDAHSQVAAKQQTWSALETEFERLNADQAAQLQETQLRCSELKQEVTALKHKASASSQDADSQEQLATVQQQLSIAQKECSSLQQQCSELKAQVDSSLAADHAALASQLSQSQEECTQLQAAIDHVKAQHSASLLTCSAFEIDLSNSAQANSDLSAELAALRQQCSFPDSSIPSFTNAAVVDTSNPQQALPEPSISQQIHQQLVSQLEAVRSELTLAQQHNADLQMQLEIATRDRATAEHNRSELESRLSQAESAVKQLQVELLSLQAELASTQLRLSELQEASQKPSGMTSNPEHPLAQVQTLLTT